MLLIFCLFDYCIYMHRSTAHIYQQKPSQLFAPFNEQLSNSIICSKTLSLTLTNFTFEACINEPFIANRIQNRTYVKFDNKYQLKKLYFFNTNFRLNNLYLTENILNNFNILLSLIYIYVYWYPIRFKSLLISQLQFHF